jgi:hypothetical protein
VARKLAIGSVVLAAVLFVAFLVFVAAAVVWTTSVWVTKVGPLKHAGLTPWIPALMAVVNAIVWPLVMMLRRRAGY